MSHSLNSINNNDKLSTVLAANSADDKLQSHSQKKIADILLKESENYSLDSNSKKEQAHQYLTAAQVLEKMAGAVRLKAQQLRSGEIDKDKAVEVVQNVVGTALQMPLPKDATPELLEQMADALEEKAKENRIMANDLLEQSEKTDKLSKQLKEQAELINQKDMDFSDLRLKSALSHNEGLKMIFEKLGVYKLDTQYKEQVAYAEKKSKEQG